MSCGTDVIINKYFPFSHKSMINELDRKQFNELYLKVPEDLQDAIYAGETGENAEAICERNKMPEIFGFLIDRVLSVYLGIMPLDKFWAEVGQRIEGKTGTKQILYEIDHFLIAPHKESIDNLYTQNAQTSATAEATTQAAN